MKQTVLLLGSAVAFYKEHLQDLEIRFKKIFDVHTSELLTIREFARKVDPIPRIVAISAKELVNPYFVTEPKNDLGLVNSDAICANYLDLLTVIWPQTHIVVFEKPCRTPLGSTVLGPVYDTPPHTLAKLLIKIHQMMLPEGVTGRNISSLFQPPVETFQEAVRRAERGPWPREMLQTGHR